MPLQLGETFAGYRVLRLLGSGGMGEVYLVQHPRLPRQEALKVLRADISSDTSFRDRFIREADLAAGLRHPHIVGVHDRGEHEGQLWISMDYVDGTDLGQLVEQRYPAGMPVGLVVPIVSAVASALDHAHKKGLLHRDVKPANIMVADLDTDDPSIYLTDFGIARPLDDTNGLTTTNMTVGTVAYSAPEQLMGEPMDGRADEYALAATTYNLLTGAQLFPHSNPAVVISRHLNTTPPNLSDCRPDCARLDGVLQKALAKNTADRFASCSAFTQNLTAAMPGQAGASANATTQAAGQLRTPASAIGGTLTKPPASRSRLVLGGAVAIIVVIGVIAVLWRPWQHSPSNGAVTSSSTAPTRPNTTGQAAEQTPVQTSVEPLPLQPTTTAATSPATVATPPPNPNGPGCSTQRPDKCGQWTPEEAAFACKATLAGADYTTDLKRMLMNRYGLSGESAFFLGKEAMYSINSGGYISTGGNADGPHPLCNDIVP
ncbi:serine/threonine protein kinase [Mycobacterium sp. ENV421]|uniref:serine/threonine-protein kinase n=1 Tax=Mycobacterium sp. ENV421 TaxID=1213407 RepID=UPI000C9B7C0E|nr:serine/threonine-protein kinase [Mycobacterium sp. ENV421]PND57702.1 serine/threonine protein kinase [Mycobacterium sp. ENV421]